MRGLVFLGILSLCFGDNLFDYELYRDALDPELCGRQLQSLGSEFYDASFRAPEGLLVGNLASLGNYHQCLAINQDFPDANIQGKYCLIRAPLTPPTVRIPSLTGASVSGNVTWTEVTLPEGLMQQFAGKALSLAVCVPKSCAVEAVLAPYAEHPVVGFNYTEQYCRLPGDKPFVMADYVAMTIFTLLGLVTIISTAYELRHRFILRKDPKNLNELFQVFSLVTNTHRLTSFSKPKPLDCVDGVRSLSILWVVVYHNFCFYFYFSKNVVNSFEAFEWIYTRRATWIISSNVAVDSFLTLSGLLLTYSSVSKKTQGSLLRGLHWFYLNRFLRLFPLLACAVLLQASLLHHAADGPGWQTMAEQVQLCRRYWWNALLHVQNIVNPDDKCLPHTWYLSVDMQLYLVSPLVLYWVLGGRRAAWAALTLSIAASLAATLSFCFIYDLPTSRMAASASAERLHDHVVLYYQNTLTRASPFFIGMLFGYVLHSFRKQEIKLQWWIVAGCHTLALAVSLYAVCVLYPSLQPAWRDHVADNINNSLRRAGWALALCWLVFACVHGYGGPVNWFLSLKMWKFLSRISYALYLYHFLVQYATVSTLTAPLYFSRQTMLNLFASDLLYGVMASAAAHVLIEEPAATLQKMFLRVPADTKPAQKLCEITADVNLTTPNKTQTNASSSSYDE